LYLLLLTEINRRVIFQKLTYQRVCVRIELLLQRDHDDVHLLPLALDVGGNL
jgi:hypothetical protein